MNFIFLISTLTTQINVDIARFKGDQPNTSRCEIYIGFPCNILSYLSTEQADKLSAKFKIKVSIKTDSNKLVDEVELERVSYINSVEEAKTHNANILEQMEIMLTPGNYKIETNIKQLDKDSSSWSVDKEVEIKEPDMTLYISDIELSSNIDTVSGTGKFVKNGLNIIPLPQRIIGEPYSTLYTYAEIYNLKIKTNYEVKYTILNDSAAVTADVPVKTLVAGVTNLTEIEALNIAKLDAGNYVLKIEITQESNKVVKKKAFIVTKLAKQRVKMASDEDLKYAALIRYIATSEDMKTYNKLSDSGKQTFITEFWRKKSPEELRRFVEGMKYADEKFGSSEEKGRDSDMGRMWIKYGKPDEIEKFQQDPTYHNAEKWNYYRGKGIVFIFVDKTGYGKYKLMYSSIKEENSVPDYTRWISPDLLEP